MKVIITESQSNEMLYRKWKRDNVTYRGMKAIGQPNERVGNTMGDGLYTVPASNKLMAKTYGDLYYVVNGKPQTPKIFNTLNDWEIWFQGTMLQQYDYDRRLFDKATNIRDEMLKLGYDGIIIKGREMVNYTPEDVLYFKTERELENYFERVKV